MKILIVDDERLICEWLQFCIQQNREYELVGCAHNGEQALDLYNQTEPDLVLTDIKMPVMGGLELLRAIKKINKETVVVLLTAFSEFELARQAIQEGADEYILKTEISNQIFQETLKRIEEKIRQKRGALSSNIENSGQKHSIIRNILLKKQYLSQEDMQKLKECNIHWRNDGLFALAVWKKQLLDDFIIPSSEQVHHVVGFEYDNLMYVVVGNLPREQSELNKWRALLEYADKIMKLNHCMVGISRISDDLRSINEAIGEAVSALSIGFYEEQVKIYEPVFSREELHSLKEKWELQFKRFYHDFYEKEGGEQYKAFQEALDYAKENKVFLIEHLTEFCCEVVETIYIRYANDHADLTQKVLQESKRKIEEALTYGEKRRYALEFASEYIWNQEVDEKKLSKSISSAVAYIRKQYNKSLSLEQIAGEVHLNPEYLSRIFKEEVGCTYSAFLADIRMKQAAYLLLHTTEKVQKIAEEVGYPNVSYFSTIFKKRFGLNPYEYRRENSQ